MATQTRSFFHIQQVEQLARQRLEAGLLPLGITAGQYLVMNLVAHHEPLSSAELSRLTGKTAQAMGDFVKTLTLKGWLERRDDPANRRVLLVCTTARGKAQLRRCEAAVDEAEREFFACLQAEEHASLRRALSRLRVDAQRRLSLAAQASDAPGSGADPEPTSSE